MFWRRRGIGAVTTFIYASVRFARERLIQRMHMQSWPASTSAPSDCGHDFFVKRVEDCGSQTATLSIIFLAALIRTSGPLEIPESAWQIATTAALCLATMGSIVPSFSSSPGT